jgi:2-keto-4-pentenoate hydratase/2-oxohepta-3-ene-1,7-dioic acid hydratase in catechol pathway
MKLIRAGAAGQETPGVLLDDDVRVDASAVAEDFDDSFLAGDGLLELSRWVAHDAAQAPRLDPGARLGPPLARPGKIVCIGLNFRDHAAESGMPLPTEPVIFFKSPTALSGPHDDVMIPRGGTKLDWEVELAVVIGRRASYVPRQDGLTYVAGYALHNDYSERSFQMERGGQWVKGKSADTFAPLGPYLATTDEVPDPQRLAMWLSVNGEQVQGSNTSQMIFDVGTLVSYVSDFMTLLPGDIISTGTPAGVGLGIKPEPRYLRPGDIVELGIDGLGTQRQRVVAYSGG